MSDTLPAQPQNWEKLRREPYRASCLGATKGYEYGVLLRICYEDIADTAAYSQSLVISQEALYTKGTPGDDQAVVRLTTLVAWIFP